jgi:hypothetical protein
MNRQRAGEGVEDVDRQVWRLMGEALPPGDDDRVVDLDCLAECQVQVGYFARRAVNARGLVDVPARMDDVHAARNRRCTAECERTKSGQRRKHEKLPSQSHSTPSL